MGTLYLFLINHLSTNPLRYGLRGEKGAKLETFGCLLVHIVLELVPGNVLVLVEGRGDGREDPRQVQFSPSHAEATSL